MSIFRSLIAVIAGVILGSMFNMAIVNIGGAIIPAPQGADVTTMDGLRESIHLFKPVNFVFPFLAHALGTLIGAAFAGIFAGQNKIIASMVVGLFFFVSGISLVVSLPSPMWFNVLDLSLAYFPMAYLGFLIARWEERRKAKKQALSQ